MTDVSERIMLEDRLRQSQKMEAVGQLTGGIAHDFNNMLTVILNSSDILAEALEDNPKLQRLAEMTTTAATRGADLTSRLLAFSRRQALQPVVIDPALLVEGVETLLRRAIPENVSIRTVLANDLWKTEVDPTQFESALLNLAKNSRDAMPDGGTLTIEVSNADLGDRYVVGEADLAPGQYVLFAISDTGSGIPSEICSRIFEPFFTTKATGKGTGLGLSMVYGFVKQSRGHIQVYSELGEGTCFKLYFPRAISEGQQLEKTSSTTEARRGHENILVVEDDPQVQEQVVAALSSLGYQVTAASSGQEALEIVRRLSPIDLVFTDVVMPGGMNGKELADAIQKERPDIRVLFTSGYTDDALIHNGRLDRDVSLLSKPYRRDQLATKIREVLDREN